MNFKKGRIRTKNNISYICFHKGARRPFWWSIRAQKIISIQHPETTRLPKSGLCSIHNKEYELTRQYDEGNPCVPVSCSSTNLGSTFNSFDGLSKTAVLTFALCLTFFKRLDALGRPLPFLFAMVPEKWISENKKSELRTEYHAFVEEHVGPFEVLLGPWKLFQLNIQTQLVYQNLDCIQFPVRNRS